MPGSFGGHKKSRIYARLDCRSAASWLERGKYVSNRFLFLEEPTPQQAGFRPWSVCLPERYDAWKARLESQHTELLGAAGLAHSRRQLQEPRRREGMPQGLSPSPFELELELSKIVAMSTSKGTEHPVVFVKGRGAGSNRPSRYMKEIKEADETDPDFNPADVRTEVTERQARSILNKNNSPDLSFDHMLNPYQGCEHGCVYCFARPTHAYLNLSPGLDFETKLFAKVNAAAVLRAELSRKGFNPGIVALGASTDAYQPIERKLQITRRVLEVLAEFNVAVGITTKSALVTRDLDILAPMAAKGLVRVHMSMPTLDHRLSRRLDPRANSPTRRLEAIH